MKERKFLENTLNSQPRGYILTRLLFYAFYTEGFYCSRSFILQRQMYTNIMNTTDINSTKVIFNHKGAYSTEYETYSFSHE
jgi:hypothetical protein